MFAIIGFVLCLALLPLLPIAISIFAKPPEKVAEGALLTSPIVVALEPACELTKQYSTFVKALYFLGGVLLILAGYIVLVFAGFIAILSGSVVGLFIVIGIYLLFVLLVIRHVIFVMRH